MSGVGFLDSVFYIKLIKYRFLHISIYGERLAILWVLRADDFVDDRGGYFVGDGLGGVSRNNRHVGWVPYAGIIVLVETCIYLWIATFLNIEYEAELVLWLLHKKIGNAVSVVHFRVFCKQDLAFFLNVANERRRNQSLACDLRVILIRIRRSVCNNASIFFFEHVVGSFQERFLFVCVHFSLCIMIGLQYTISTLSRSFARLMLAILDSTYWSSCEIK